MAITVSDNNTQRDSYDGAYAGTNIGSGAGGATGDDSFYEGTNSWGRKIATASAERGFSTVITTIDQTAAANAVLMSKGLLLNNSAVEAFGMRIRIGTGTTDYYAFVVADEGTRGDVTYPFKGGWVISPLNPNLTAWRDELGGAGATLTGVTNVAITAQVSSVSKDLNLFLDAADFSRGLYLVGTSPDGTWLDFLSYDEGIATAGARIGHVTSVNGILYVYGGMVIGRNAAGTSTLTAFTDSNRTIVFPGGRVDAGWNFIELDLATASTAISLSNMVHSGVGRTNKKRYFDTELQVDNAGDFFTIPSHGFLLGEAVLYSVEGGSAISGLTDSTEYFVGEVATDTFTLFTTRALAIAAGASIAVAPAATPGANHSFRRQPSTAPDFTVTSTTGTATIDACTFNTFRAFTWTTKPVVTASNFINCFSMSIPVGGVSMSGCTFSSPLVPVGEAFATAASADDFDDISDSEFIASSLIEQGGHAMRVTTDGTVAQNTADLTDVVFTDYGPALVPFNPSTDVDDANDEIDITAHGFVDGDPVYYVASDHITGTVGTAITGLTSGGLYYVEEVTANSISLHRTRASALLGASGNTIAISTGSNENHQICSAHAAFYNSTGGDVIINVTGGNGPSVRNSSGSTTTVDVSVPIEINGVTEGAQCYMEADGVTGPLGAGIEVFNQAANSAGEATGSFTGTTPQGVTIRVRSSGTVAAAVSSDGGVLTTETDDARDGTGMGDVPLCPGGAVDDGIYVGGLTQFARANFIIGTQGVGAYTLTWEYWNGAWTALTVVDGTDNFKNPSGAVTFTAPGDWVTTSVNSLTYYWIRALGDAGAQTTPPLGDTISISGGNVTKYLPFETSGEIASGTGLTVTAVWLEDTIAN